MGRLAECEVFIMGALIVLRVIPRARLVSTVEDITYYRDAIVPWTETGPISTKITIVDAKITP